MPEANNGAGIFSSIQSPSTVYNGQVTLTGTPAVNALAAATTIKSVTIENVSTNATVYVGNATVTIANGYALRPGATISLDIDSLSKVYVIGTAGNIVTYIAVN
jgi:hypothetical protein